MLRTGHSSALYTCWKYGSARKRAMLLTPTSERREPAVNVAGEAWLARTWASENVGSKPMCRR